MILKQFEVSGMAVFAYLLGEEGGGAGLVIDPADGADRILAEAEKNRIKIQYILNTHAHVDHVMGNEEMKKKTGAQIIIHEADASSLTRIPRAMLAMFGGRPSPAADQTVKDEDVIQVGSLSLKVLHTPGHSAGSISILGDGVVFTGDTLFNFGIGRYDTPGGSYSQIMNSLHTKLMVLPDDTAVYPGHGPDTTIGVERRRNPFLTQSF